MMAKGYIHSVETFGTVDGPGIRYVIFLQGCPLRCKYCHNRDTWEVNKNKQVTTAEVISDIKKYLRFYLNSGGGVTASGGEPALQADFVTKIFSEIKKLNLNTALDTSGFILNESVRILIEVTDLVLLDIKAVDPLEHKELTGVSNEPVIDFAVYLNEKNKPVWIRHVLIPGINDDKNHLSALAKFLQNFNNIKRVEILGYHKLGATKWKLCGETDPLNNVRAADSSDVERARRLLIEAGVKNVK